MGTTEIVAVAGVIITNVITIITLYMHLDNKTDKTLMAIQAEIRDFHGRLCAIEERNRKC